MAKILLVIASEGYQDIEFEDTKAVLEENKHQVLTASSKTEATGSLGGNVIPDLQINEVNEKDFDAIAFIGGPGCYEYFENPKALKIAKDFYSAGKITSAICAAPAILAKAGILKNKKTTCYPSVENELTKAGAIYTANTTEKDENIITGNGPKSAKEFGKLIAENLKKQPPNEC